MKRYATTGILMLLLSGLQLHLYAAPISNSTRFILSPVLGADRNEMQVRGVRGGDGCINGYRPGIWIVSDSRQFPLCSKQFRFLVGCE